MLETCFREDEVELIFSLGDGVLLVLSVLSIQPFSHSTCSNPFGFPSHPSLIFGLVYSIVSCSSL
jgi:hypothetical protein